MAWIGRPFQDPSGVRIGHVVSVEDDGRGGLYLVVHGDWGALDWLHALGSGPETEARVFRFHAGEVEETPSGALRLKGEVLERREAG
jgi:hypothetical protein